MNVQINRHFPRCRPAAKECSRLEGGGWKFGGVENCRPDELPQHFAAHDVGAGGIDCDENRTLLGSAGVEVEGAGNFLKSAVVVGDPKMGNGKDDLRVMRFDLIGA